MGQALYKPKLGVCTISGKTLYVHLHQWPVSDAILLPVSGKVKSDNLIAEETDNGLVVQGLPAAPADKTSPWLIPIEFTKAPVPLPEQKKRTLEADPAGTVFLPPEAAEIETVNGVIIPKLNKFPDGRVSMGSLHQIGDKLTWNVKLPEAGKFEVHAAFGTIKCQDQSGFELSCGKSKLKGTTWFTGDWSQPTRKAVGRISLKKGKKRISLKVTAVPNGSFSDIHGIWLVKKA